MVSVRPTGSSPALKNERIDCFSCFFFCALLLEILLPNLVVCMEAFFLFIPMVLYKSATKVNEKAQRFYFFAYFFVALRLLGLTDFERI